MEQAQGKPYLTRFEIHPPLDPNAPIQTLAYPDFGLYIFRGARLYCAIRCGSNGQNGNGGHAHNDQLSLELAIDSEDLIRDPGTYLYTPLPKQRNVYRATQSHFTPQQPGQEQNDWLAGTPGLFSLQDQAQAVLPLFRCGWVCGQTLRFWTSSLSNCDPRRSANCGV